MDSNRKFLRERERERERGKNLLQFQPIVECVGWPAGFSHTHTHLHTRVCKCVRERETGGKCFIPGLFRCPQILSEIATAYQMLQMSPSTNDFITHFLIIQFEIGGLDEETQTKKSDQFDQVEGSECGSPKNKTNINQLEIPKEKRWIWRSFLSWQFIWIKCMNIWSHV